MTDIKSMTQQELSQFLKELGEPAFRAKQVFTWLHRGAASFDEMTNLSKSLREKLKGRCFITAPVVARKQESRLTAPSSTCGSCRTATALRRC